MVIHELDAWRDAKRLIRDHGPDAARVAAAPAEALMAKGDLHGILSVMATIEAIAALRNRASVLRKHTAEIGATIAHSKGLPEGIAAKLGETVVAFEQLPRRLRKD